MVQDYYYGIGHDGISSEVLEASVSIGDIIVLIDEKNVQSSKFSDILELLRSLKNTSKKIVFRNVSTSCE